MLSNRDPASHGAVDMWAKSIRVKRILGAGLTRGLLSVGRNEHNITIGLTIASLSISRHYPSWKREGKMTARLGELLVWAPVFEEVAFFEKSSLVTNISTTLGS